VLAVNEVASSDAQALSEEIQRSATLRLRLPLSREKGRVPWRFSAFQVAAGSDSILINPGSYHDPLVM